MVFSLLFFVAVLMTCEGEMAKGSSLDKEHKLKKRSTCIQTTNGDCCVFPFIYNNVQYNECTSVDWTKAWCATTSNYDTDGMWGECGNYYRTVDGTSCVFPFTYKGVTYHTCTNVDGFGGYWCPTVPNYDGSSQQGWGYCRLD